VWPFTKNVTFKNYPSYISQNNISPSDVKYSINFNKLPKLKILVCLPAFLPKGWINLFARFCGIKLCIGRNSSIYLTKMFNDLCSGADRHQLTEYILKFTIPE